MAANRIYIQVDFQQQQAVSNVNQLNQAIASLGPQTQKTSQQASQGISSMTMSIQQAQRSFAGIGSAIAGLGLIRGGQQLVNIAADIDTLRKTLEFYEGSQAAANKRFDEFRQMAQKPGISLEPAIQSYARLMSVVKDSRESMRIIEGFGKALGQMGRGGTDLTGVLEQVTQSLSKRGSVMREDLKFIQQYVPQVTEILEKLYGTSDTGKLTKQGISAAQAWHEVTNELLRMQEVAPGIRKQMDLWLQEMRLVGEEFGKSLAQEVKPALDEILKASQALAKLWTGLSPETRTLVIQLGEAALAFGAIATAVGLLIKAVTALAAVLMAHPVVAAVLLGGAAIYAQLKSTESITAWADKKAGGQGYGTFAKMGFAWDLMNYRPTKPYFGIEPPQGPGVPKGMAPPEAGYEKTSAYTFAKLGLDDDDVKKKAQDLAKYIRGLERQTADAVRDAWNDQRKARVGSLEGAANDLKRLREQLLVVTDEMNKKTVKLWEESREHGLEGIPPQVQENLDTERARRLGTARLKWIEDIRKRELEALADVAEANEETRQRMIDRRSEGYAELLKTQSGFLEQMQEQELHAQLQMLDAERDRRLAMLEELGGETLAQQMQLADERLKVENDYVEKALEINLKLLDLEKQRAIFQLQATASMAGLLDSEQYNKALNALMDMYQMREDAMSQSASDQRESNRLKTLHDQTRMIRSEMQKTFEYFQNLAEGVFDALLSKSKSVTQALGDFVKTTFLTIIKSLYSQMIAGILTRLVYGAPAGGGGGRGGFTGGVIPGGSGGGTGGGGPLGWLGPILSGGRGGFGGWGGGGGWGGWGGGTFPGGTGVGATGAAGSGGGLLGVLGLGGGIGGGPLGLLRTLGNLGMKTGLTGEKFGSVPGMAGSNATGVGGLAGGAMLLGGGTLAYMGLKRGGFSGLAMTTAGGALIGAKFGGPLGAAIGAAAGAAAGTIRLFIKGAKEKTRQRIKEIYGIDISSNGILDQITQLVKSQYGGDMNVGLYSPEVRELVSMYAMTQGQSATGVGRPMYPVSWAMSGGSTSLQPVYTGGSLVASPYVGPTTTQQNATFVQLNPQQANQLFEGRVVQIVGNNPGAVADAATSAMEPTYRRSREQGNLIEPMTLL